VRAVPSRVSLEGGKTRPSLEAGGLSTTVAGEDCTAIQKSKEEERLAKVAELEHLVLALEMRTEERLAAEAAAKKNEEEPQGADSAADSARMVADLERLVSTVNRKAEERLATEAAAKKRQKDNMLEAVRKSSPLERLVEAAARAAKEERALSERSSETPRSHGLLEVGSSVDTTADVTEDPYPYSAEVESANASYGSHQHEWKWVPITVVDSDDTPCNGSRLEKQEKQISVKIFEHIPLASPVPATLHGGHEISEMEAKLTRCPATRQAPRWMKCCFLA